VGGGRGPLPLHLCSSGRSCPPLQLGVQAAPCSPAALRTRAAAQRRRRAARRRARPGASSCAGVPRAGRLPVRRAWPGLLCVAAPPLALRIACCEPMDGKQAGLKQDRIFFATVGPWA